ncbi:MAG TPA: LysR family transcriptional regulator [Gemmatimonadales bacterium]
MELRHLKYFVAVAEARSFVRAAGRLRVAQPSLSRQIRDLEQELGVKLFDRLPRGTRLTRAGEAFLEDARRTLDSASSAVATARRVVGTETLTLAHGDMYVYTPELLELVAAFRRHSPQTTVRVVRVSEADQRTALRERRIDAAAMFVSAWPVPGLAALPLVDATVTGVLLPAAHPLAAQPRIALKDLADLTWLHPSERTRPELFRALRSALLSRGLVPGRRYGRRGDSASSLLIAAGDAWSLANPAVAQVSGVAEPAIVYRPFTDPPIPVWLALVWRCDIAAPVVNKLVEVAEPIAAKLPTP